MEQRHRDFKRYVRLSLTYWIQSVNSKSSRRRNNCDGHRVRRTGTILARERVGFNHGNIASADSREAKQHEEVVYATSTEDLEQRIDSPCICGARMGYHLVKNNIRSCTNNSLTRHRVGNGQRVDRNNYSLIETRAVGP